MTTPDKSRSDDTVTELDETVGSEGSAQTGRSKGGFAHRLYTGDISYDFIGHRKMWYIVSAIVMVACFVSLGVRGLNLGIEFRGGAEFTVAAQATDEAVTQVREAVQALGLPEMSDVTVQKIGDNSIRVQTRSVDTDEIPAIKKAIGDAVQADSNDVGYTLVGASWGQQITNRGLIALGVFLLLVSLLIWVYFREWKMAVTATIALLHDLVLTMGVFALMGFAFTPASLIGMLTILGYSLYDTVVVFDKVRENTTDLANTDSTYSQAANLAINQVLVRSINTTIIGVLPVAALLFTGVFVLGTGPLKDVGLVLFVGMLAGAYSSIFIAAPMLAQLKEREPDMQRQRKRVERRAHKAAAKVAVTMNSTDSIDSPTQVPVRRDKRSQGKGR